MTKKPVVSASLVDGTIITEDSDAARELYNQSRYGVLDSGRLALSLLEAMYLFEKGRLLVFNGRRKELSYDALLRKARKFEHHFSVRYAVFKNMRDRGYIVKTALKFGADFRVYDRGVKPGEDHAKWVIFPVKEGETLTWHEFSAKNRVAHSTKKRLMIGVVDAEQDCTYWEVKWVRP